MTTSQCTLDRAVADTSRLVVGTDTFSSCFKKLGTDGQRTGSPLLRLLLNIWRRGGRRHSQRCQLEQVYLCVKENG